LDRAYLEASWLKEGVFLSTVAANDSKLEVVAQADRLVLTNMEEFDNPIWLVGLAIAKGLRSREEFVSMGSIITGQNPGRQNDTLAEWGSRTWWPHTASIATPNRGE